MGDLKRDLSYLMLGQQGGKNRIKILERLKERSYNTNQLAEILDLNYRTIKHHRDILMDHGLIEKSGGGYGDVYFLSPKVEKNYDLLESMKNKLETVFESPKLYKKIIEQTHEGIIVLDENRDITFLNKSAESVSGYDHTDLLGRSIEVLLEPDIHDGLESVMTNDEFVEKTMKIETKSGKIKTVVVTMDCFQFDGEENKVFSLLMRDISKKENQQEILNALMSHSSVIMAYLNLDFDLIYVNSAYAEKTDYSPEELIGKNHFDLFPNEENEKIFKEVINEGESRSIKDRDLLYPDGSDQEGPYWTLGPVEGDGKEIKGLVLSLYEIEGLS